MVDVEVWLILPLVAALEELEPQQNLVTRHPLTSCRFMSHQKQYISYVRTYVRMYVYHVTVLVHHHCCKYTTLKRSTDALSPAARAWGFNRGHTFIHVVSSDVCYSKSLIAGVGHLEVSHELVQPDIWKYHKTRMWWWAITSEMILRHDALTYPISCTTYICTQEAWCIAAQLLRPYVHRYKLISSAYIHMYTQKSTTLFMRTYVSSCYGS